MADTMTSWTVEELRAEAREIKAAIFAYEMAADTHRIDAANVALDAVYAELRRRG